MKVISDYTLGRIISRLHYKVESNVTNNSQQILGIDLLKKRLKKELFVSILVQIEKLFLILLKNPSKKSIDEILKKEILLKLISDSIEDFLFKNYGVPVKINKEIIENSLSFKLLLDDFKILLNLLLEAVNGSKQKKFNSLFFPVYSVSTEEFIEALFDNLLIIISDCVMYILIIEITITSEIRQIIYNNRFLSLRNFEGFKNNFIWNLQTKVFMRRPSDIYNNRYLIYIIRASGIYSRSIYANRPNELFELKGLPLLTITFIEGKDFLLSRIDELLYFLGTSVRFTLISIVGKFIGLVWRGIIEGLK